MNLVPNDRAGVDAGSPFLVAFLCGRPGTSHRGRWAISPLCEAR